MDRESSTSTTKSFCCYFNSATVITGCQSRRRITAINKLCILRTVARTPDHTIDMVLGKIPRGSGVFNTWLVNGKPYPHDRKFILEQGKRYRLVFRNRTDDAHPKHLHRHLLELTEINSKRTFGILKDSFIVPYYGRASVDLTADQPGLARFHCHIQQHMDYGFKALKSYS